MDGGGKEGSERRQQRGDAEEAEEEETRCSPRIILHVGGGSDARKLSLFLPLCSFSLSHHPFPPSFVGVFHSWLEALGADLTFRGGGVLKAPSSDQIREEDEGQGRGGSSFGVCASKRL